MWPWVAALREDMAAAAVAAAATEAAAAAQRHLRGGGTGGGEPGAERGEPGALAAGRSGTVCDTLMIGLF